MHKMFSALPLTALLLLQACSLSSHPLQPSNLGTPTTLAAAEAKLDEAGPIDVESVTGADWQVPLGSLLNLKDPAARAAGLEDKNEAIQIYAHVLRHPKHGAFLVDTGVARALADAPADFGVNAIMRKMMQFDLLVPRESTEQVVKRLGPQLHGVFFTHLHLDHITGLPAIPAQVPLYAGRGETSGRSFENLFVRGVTDSLFKGKAALREWPFDGKDAAPLSSVIDIFGDGSVFALNVPGHTSGSTAYLVRTTKGPLLLTGDTCHTRWGWEHGVEPGSFTADQAQNRRSLEALKALAARHPTLQVRLGHQ